MSDADPVGVSFVELDLVDRRVEPVIDGPQGLQGLPYDLVAFVVF